MCKYHIYNYLRSNLVLKQIPTMLVITMAIKLCVSVSMECMSLQGNMLRIETSMSYQLLHVHWFPCYIEQYYISLQKAFKIDVSTGVISINTSLDRELMESVKLEIIVEDLNAFSSTSQTATGILFATYYFFKPVSYTIIILFIIHIFHI